MKQGCWGQIRFSEWSDSELDEIGETSFTVSILQSGSQMGKSENISMLQMGLMMLSSMYCNFITKEGYWCESKHQLIGTF